jgi:polyhydroxybutyrate depolymerase
MNLSKLFSVCLLAVAVCTLQAEPQPKGPPRSSHSIRGHITFGEIDRTYLLYRPANLAKANPVPLVVMLHGRHDSDKYAEFAYHWDTTADQHGFVVVYPNGYHGTWNGGECCGASQKDKIDDAGFLTQLINDLIQQQNIDANRIYIAGMSNGGIMAYRMACDSPLHIAAIGSVSGDLVEVCKMPHPTSVIEVHGGEDKLLPFNGKGQAEADGDADGGYIPSVQWTLDHWIIADKCDDAKTTTTGEIVDTVRQCDAGRAVELIEIKNAGHQWPGSKRHLRIDDLFGTAEPSPLLNATEKLWAFFAAHPLQ